jgi:hypothetical protein
MDAFFIDATGIANSWHLRPVIASRSVGADDLID